MFHTFGAGAPINVSVWKGNCVFFYWNLIPFPSPNPQPTGSWRNSGLAPSRSVSRTGEEPRRKKERPKEISTQVEHLSLEISSFETNAEAAAANVAIESQRFFEKQETTAIFIHQISLVGEARTARWRGGRAKTETERETIRPCAQVPTKSLTSSGRCLVAVVWLYRYRNCRAETVNFGSLRSRRNVLRRTFRPIPWHRRLRTALVAFDSLPSCTLVPRWSLTAPSLKRRQNLSKQVIKLLPTFVAFDLHSNAEFSVSLKAVKFCHKRQKSFFFHTAAKAPLFGSWFGRAWLCV